MTAKSMNVRIAETIFDDTYGRGHGKEITVSKFISVLEMTEESANTLFESIKNGES